MLAQPVAMAIFDGKVTESGVVTPFSGSGNTRPNPGQGGLQSLGIVAFERLLGQPKRPDEPLGRIA
jgi:hypothetical protein